MSISCGSVQPMLNAYFYLESLPSLFFKANDFNARLLSIGTSSFVFIHLKLPSCPSNKKGDSRDKGNLVKMRKKQGLPT